MLVEQMKLLGITDPTEIQEKAIPLVLKGKDVIAQSQTGTGKTFAFLLPIIDSIDSNDRSVQALIIAPTRELALQITSEAQKLLEAYPECHVLPIYGGQDVEQQLRKLAGAIHLIIATPGRLLDHIRRETVSLHNVKKLVLDEADQMLHMGFLGEVEKIIEQTSNDRQTLLFSATMPEEIRQLSSKYLKNPEHLSIKKRSMILDEITQIVIKTTDRGKQEALRAIIKEEQPFLGIIFCRTQRRTNKLYEALHEKGYLVEVLHGGLSQAKREEVMSMFREARVQYLVATDVAARGLDVEGVTHVFNYDIPHDVESYIHRIGRTGRGGEVGRAITFVASKDRHYLDLIEKGIGKKLNDRSHNVGKPLHQTR
ncbi:DEAD-box ATP-dependent RNA helicase CshA [Halalkalibacter krulwichiae]|uniref:RNA helicase n=2 Tax=Halalkalibacter krulwichiae TaxID=199441 RepID=A0A1X9MBC6_9BACI|nr:DEAD-box ATP-dependent RNA helicase CshA [Halalkalibacter krulwichiae]